MTNTDIVTAILAEEGSFTNDPFDPGGATKYGVTQKTLAWARGAEVTVAEVQALTEEEARAIYLRLYILGPGFDKIQDARLRWQVADFGVNSGPYVATKYLQRALRVPVDGVMGPGTLAAVNTVSDPVALGNSLAILRVTMLMGLAVPKQSPFWSGWLRRALKFISPTF